MDRLIAAEGSFPPLYFNATSAMTSAKLVVLGAQTVCVPPRTHALLFYFGARGLGLPNEKKSENGQVLL